MPQRAGLALPIPGLVVRNGIRWGGDSSIDKFNQPNVKRLSLARIRFGLQTTFHAFAKSQFAKSSLSSGFASIRLHILFVPSFRRHSTRSNISTRPNISSRLCLFLPSKKKLNPKKTQTNRTEHNKRTQTHTKHNTRTEGYLDRACLHLSRATTYEPFTPHHSTDWTWPPNLV